MTPKAKEPKQEPKPKPKEDEMTNALIPFAQLKDQYLLPIEQQKQLIRSDQTPTDNAIKLAVECARMFGVPLQGINLIPTRNGVYPYINADGIRWKLHTDPRGLKSVETKILQMPNGDGSLIVVEGIVEFQDGSRFTDIGATTVDETNKSGKGKWNASDSLMKASTKAERRAGRRAVGVTLPTYEDYIEYREAEMKDVTPMLTVAQSINNNGHPQTLAELLVKMNAAKMDTDVACTKLGVATIADVKDFSGAWDKLQA